jgi:2-C-methyl-D-erythritol 4-phosphate cytidylyltransferase
MNSDVPKQFLLLAGQPLLMHSIRIFNLFEPEMPLFVTLPENQFDYWKQLCKDHSFRIPHQLVKGGETRFGSVKNALEQVEGDGLIAIHDGVRPLVSLEVIQRTFAEADKYGNAIPVIRMQESIREITPWANKEVNRGNLRIVQTPQVFRKALIKEAYDFVSSENFTDDATVVEKLGVGIHLVEGNPENLKITTPADLRCAEAILGHSALQN